MSGISDSTAEAQEPGLSKRAAEFSVALLLLLIAILVVWDNQRIGAGWDDTGPQAGYFPLRVGIAVGVSALLVAWSAWRAQSTELFVTWTQLKSVCQVLIPLVVYVAAIGWLGIYVASALFIALFMRYAGGYVWWKALALGSVTNVLMFWVFEIQFKVPLPKGPLEAALGY